MRRKSVQAVMVALWWIVATAGAAHADSQSSYPAKPVRIVVGFPPGDSPSNLIARMLGQKFTESWGQPVVIENVPGANGSISADRVAKALPDGYTLGLQNTSQVVFNPSLYKLSYNPTKDFAPISQVASSASVLVVSNSVGVKSVGELVALAKTRPRELTFATAGSGAQSHLSAELLKSMAGIDMAHIPYKGLQVALPDLIAGRVTVAFIPVSMALPLMRDNRLRALAVTSSRRSSKVPDLPTMDESGYRGFEATIWNGLLAPAGTPATIIRKLYLETVRALALEEVQARFADLGMEVVGSSPEEFQALIRSETTRWAKLIKESGVKPE